LVLDNLTTGSFAISSAGFKSEDVKSMIKLEVLNANLEMATGNLTDQITAEGLRIALQQLKDIGAYQRNMNQWGLVD
jgi:hypothetical protein